MSESLFSENIFNSPVVKMINDVISLCCMHIFTTKQPLSVHKSIFNNNEEKKTTTKKRSNLISRIQNKMPKWSWLCIVTIFMHSPDKMIKTASAAIQSYLHMCLLVNVKIARKKTANIVWFGWITICKYKYFSMSTFTRSESIE